MNRVARATILAVLLVAAWLGVLVLAAVVYSQCENIGSKILTLVGLSLSSFGFGSLIYGEGKRLSGD